MKVHLPQSEEFHSIKLRVELLDPHEDFTAHVTVANGVGEFALPEGIDEDDVRVTARYTDHRSEQVGERMVLKEAVVREPEPEPEPEVKDEDAPVEAGEEVAQSPAPEVRDGEVHEEVKKSRPKRRHR